jgi:hypothetical protein
MFQWNILYDSEIKFCGRQFYRYLQLATDFVCIGDSARQWHMTPVSPHSVKSQVTTPKDWGCFRTKCCEEYLDLRNRIMLSVRWVVLVIPNILVSRT